MSETRDLTNAEAFGTDPATDPVDELVSPTLPMELIIAISEFLAGSYDYRSLARLNVISKAVHEETLPVLFETVVWDSGVKWWILDRGHLPKGWGYTKYLVVLEDSISQFEHYLAAISSSRTTGRSKKFTTIFPRIAMLIVKSGPKLNMVFPLNPMLEVSINLYKPVNVHTFLTASTTSAGERQSVFFGAPCGVPHEKLIFIERITQLNLGKNAGVQPSPQPIRFPDDWQARHIYDPDFKLVAFKDDAFDLDDAGINSSCHPPGADAWALNRTETGEVKVGVAVTVEALLSIIPPRKEQSDLCHFEINCNVDELDGLSTMIPESLQGHLKIVVQLKQHGFDEVKDFQDVMTTLAENYVGEWNRLGPIGHDKVFFRVEYTDFEYVASASPPDFDDDESSTEWMFIATLTTLPAPGRNPGRRYSAKKQSTSGGFELMIKRVVFDDDTDWFEDQSDQEVLFKKMYRV